MTLLSLMGRQNMEPEPQSNYNLIGEERGSDNCPESNQLESRFLLKGTCDLGHHRT